MPPPAKRASVLCSHHDQVTSLPLEAELLGRSEFCPVEMYSIGSHIFCIQGHPEFSSQYAKALWKFREPQLGSPLSAKAVNSLSEDFSNKLMQSWILNFLTQTSFLETFMLISYKSSLIYSKRKRLQLHLNRQKYPHFERNTLNQLIKCDLIINAT